MIHFPGSIRLAISVASKANSLDLLFRFLCTIFYDLVVSSR